MAVDKRPRTSLVQQPPKQPQSPQALAGAELTAVAVLAPFQCVVARIKQFCLQVHDVALVCREESCKGMGGERQAGTVTGGSQHPAASHVGLVYLKTSKKTEPDFFFIFFYKKAATFYCSKNTRYTRSLMNKTNYSSQRNFKTQHTAWEQTDIQL